MQGTDRHVAGVRNSLIAANSGGRVVKNVFHFHVGVQRIAAQVQDLALVLVQFAKFEVGLRVGVWIRRWTDLYECFRHKQLVRFDQYVTRRLIFSRDFFDRQDGSGNIGIRGARYGVFGIEIEAGVLSDNLELVEPSLNGEDKTGPVGAFEKTGIDHAIGDMNKVDELFIQLVLAHQHAGLTRLGVAEKREQAIQALSTLGQFSDGLGFLFLFGFFPVTAAALILSNQGQGQGQQEHKKHLSS